MNIRNSSLGERVRDSSIIAGISGIMTGGHQLAVGSNVNQILESSSTEVLMCFLSSSLNLWLYDMMKKYGKFKTKLTDNQIIFLSIGILSLWVGATRGGVHFYIGTKNPEHLAVIFAVGNALSGFAYEKVALQNNFINKVSAKVKNTLGKLGNKKK